MTDPCVVLSPEVARRMKCLGCGNWPLTYSPDCVPSLWCARCGLLVGDLDGDA